MIWLWMIPVLTIFMFVARIPGRKQRSTQICPYCGAPAHFSIESFQYGAVMYRHWCDGEIRHTWMECE